MGLIREGKPNKNGQVPLEIIYGGKEAPFGGIDVSASSRYIDPKCFADASNFLLVDNELCITSFLPVTSPFTNGVSYPAAYPSSVPSLLLGMGKLPCEGVVKTWALFAGQQPDTDNLIQYTLCIWVPGSSTLSYDFALPAQQIMSPAVNAQATVIFGYNSGLSAVQSQAAPPSPVTYDGFDYEYAPITISINGAPTSFPPVVFGYYPLYGNTPASGPVTLPTPATMATAFASLINGGSYPFTAVVSGINTNEVILTSTVVGAAGNGMSLGPAAFNIEYGYYPNTTGLSFNIVPNVPVFTRPSFTVGLQQFAGGKDAGQLLFSSLPIQQLTYETVGDNLFLAGYPAGYMLWFQNSTSQFGLLTAYQGARVLKKYTAHLISVGLINSAVQTETQPHLWLNWSAPEGQYAIWNALDASGNITGAGGGQLADISDMLTGLVITNSTAFILRADGLSYATPLTSGEDPFDINHVALSEDGQGCSSSQLYCQYDQLGFYVGESNVFLLGQSPQAVGTKIAADLFPSLIDITQNPLGGNFQDVQYQSVNVKPLLMQINNRSVVFYAVNIGGLIYVYDPGMDTWMKLDGTQFAPDFSTNVAYALAKIISLPAMGVMGFGGSFQYRIPYFYTQAVSRIDVSSGFMVQAPNLYQITNQIGALQTASVTFPAEEVMAGRDISIDSAYIEVSGVPGTIFQVTLSGWQGEPATYMQSAFAAEITLDANATPDVIEEYQVFSTVDGQAITLKAPQLNVTVPAQTPPAFAGNFPVDSNPQFKISKLSMFGTYDPNQRPV